MDPKEWIPKWATRGDLAAAAVGYAVGFAVDVFYYPDGVSPGTTAGVFAVGAVGLKNAGQGVIEDFRKRNQELRDRLALEGRVAVLLQTLTDEGLDTAAGRLARDLHLWRKGVLDDGDLQQILDEVVGDYRGRRLSGPDPYSPVASGRFQTLEVDKGSE